MRRRNFISLSAAASAGLILPGCGKRNDAVSSSATLVDTPEKRRKYLESMLDEICGLGPRPIGSPAMRKSAEIVERELKRSLPQVELDNFELVRWILHEQPELTIGGTTLEAFPAHGSAGTPGEGLRGVLKRSGENVKSAPYTLTGSRGNALAYISVSPYGRAVPRPWYNFGLEFGCLPVFNLGRQDSLLAEEAVEKGLPVVLKDSVEFKSGSNCCNVAGHIPGRSGQEILFIAHLDTVYNTPGANDNTASVIAMVMLAHALAGQTLERGVTFLATSGEEYNKAGAEHYAARRRGEGTYDKIRFLVNVDSATWGPDMQISTSDDQLWQTIQEIDTQLELPGAPVLSGPDGFALDGRPFRDTGARAMYVNSTGYELSHLWHRPEDTPETVPADCAEIFFRLMLEYLNRIQTI